MNCLLIDDEPSALELLEGNVSKVPYLNQIGTARSGMEAFHLLSKLPVDLIFLDIEMQDMTGLAFLKSLNNPPLVILITAYKEYALEAFNFNVVDYLVKPVPFPRFLKAIQKAQLIFNTTKSGYKIPADESAYVFVNANYSLVKVMLNEIVFIEGMKDYVRIHLTTGKEVITRLGLKVVENSLSTQTFMRIHKSYIIALDKITSIQKTQLIIQNREIPIGDGYRQSLQKYISAKNL